MSQPLPSSNLCVQISQILSLLNKRTTLIKNQGNFGHTSVGNKSLRENVTAFDLAGSQEFLAVVSINASCKWRFILHGCWQPHVIKEAEVLGVSKHCTIIAINHRDGCPG